MVKTVRRIFKLPYQGELLYTQLDPQYVEGTMQMMLEKCIPLTPTLKISSFLSKYKLMISIVHQCYLGLLGLLNQVYANQSMLLAGLMLDQAINFDQAFISNLLADQKVFRRENRIKLGGKVSSIILEDLKDQDILQPCSPQTDRMLQSNTLALQYMGLKVTTYKPAKGIIIKEGTKRKGIPRSALAGKWKKVVETEVLDEKSPEQLPLKRMRQTAAEMAQQLLIDKPEPIPEFEPELEPCPLSFTNSLLATYAHILTPSHSCTPNYIPPPRAEFSQPHSKVSLVNIPSTSPPSPTYLAHKPLSPRDSQR